MVTRVSINTTHTGFTSFGSSVGGALDCWAQRCRLDSWLRVPARLEKDNGEKRKTPTWQEKQQNRTFSLQYLPLLACGELVASSSVTAWTRNMSKTWKDIPIHRNGQCRPWVEAHDLPWLEEFFKPPAGLWPRSRRYWSRKNVLSPTMLY